MEMTLKTLVLLCKRGEERIPFAKKLSFFHGEMSTGKSTVVEMVNYCLGASLVRTPAVTSEVVGVQLILDAGGTEILIERAINSGSSASVTWSRGSGRRLDNMPLIAGKDPIVGDDVFNLSDFLLRCMGVPLLKVRRSKIDENSELHRIGFRDFYKFVYLDQDELDSSFFLLETPIRQEKSKDVLRYVLGFHSDQLAELEINLTSLKQKQRAIRESAKQIDEFLSKYGFSSEDEISAELAKLDVDLVNADQAIQSLTPSNVPTSYISDEVRADLDRLTADIDAKELAAKEVTSQLRDQQSLAAELLGLKLKIARSSIANEILEGAAFHLCPACGSALAKPSNPQECVLCHSNTSQIAKAVKLNEAVVQRDLIDRIEDLERSTRRLKKSLERHEADLGELREARGALQRRVDAARASGESQYMQRMRSLESKKGALDERRRLLVKVAAMPREIEARRKDADKMSEEISLIERQIGKEQEKFAAGRENVSILEQTFHAVLRAIHFPAIAPGDTVYLNTKTWLPYIHPSGNAERAWSFADVGSGGKKVLFKICFALALHVTAARQKLSLPKLLIIDSTMKNITPDINPDVVSHFYRELYRLLSTELRDWQCILVDQTYFAPPVDIGLQVVDRMLKKDDPKYPRLISYYDGH
jgi:hypothetical protein